MSSSSGLGHSLSSSASFPSSSSGMGRLGGGSGSQGGLPFRQGVGVGSSSSASGPPPPSLPRVIYPTKVLLPLITAAKMGPEGRRRLQQFEFYPNWLCMPNEVPLYESEVDGVISQLRSVGNDMFPRRESEKLLTTFGLSPIMTSNALAFMLILKQDFRSADDCLAESNRLIELCLHTTPSLIRSEYLQGAFHIVKGLQILLESHTNWVGMGQFDFETFLITNVDSFDSLPIKAQAAVMASKITFLNLIDNGRKGLKVMSYEELVSMDPDNSEWRIHHYLEARRKRFRTVGGSESIPGSEEVKTIQEAWNMCPTNPLVIMYVCHVLTEHLRNFVGNKAVGEPWMVNCGQWQFKSESEAAAVIKNMLLKVVVSNPECVALQLIASDILTSSLPYKFRDYGFGRECVFQAFRCGQHTSSRANHSLANFLLRRMHVNSPILDRSHSANLLEKALVLNSRNTDALLDLLRLFLSHPEENGQSIRLLIETYLNSPNMSPGVLRELMFLKGCYHVLIGENENAVLSWISVYTTLQSRVNFSALAAYSYMYRLFEWSFEKINLPIIIFLTNNFHSLLPSPSKISGVAYGLPASSSSTQSFERRTQTQDEEMAIVAQVKDALMSMIADQFQALNSDELYKTINANYSTQNMNLVPIHHQFPYSHTEASQVPNSSSNNNPTDLDLRQQPSSSRQQPHPHQAIEYVNNSTENGYKTDEENNNLGNVNHSSGNNNIDDDDDDPELVFHLPSSLLELLGPSPTPSG